MSPEEELCGLACQDMPVGDDEVREVLDKFKRAYAHELATKQRAAIPDIMEEWGGSLHQDMLSDLIKVIDPEVPGG